MTLDRIRVVLVRPKSSGNVGSVARAMKNNGVSDLVVVAPRRFRRFTADAMAVHATDVLDGMRLVNTLPEALTDCHWTLGTTCRPGLYRSRTRTPREAAEDVLSVAANNHRIALVFGPEDTGLSNRDLAACDELLSIPTHKHYASLNVAQAVLVCLYELFIAGEPPAAERVRLATAERSELLYDKLREALVAIGFLPVQNPDHIMLAIRRMFGRARMEERDLKIWLGIARQIGWYASGGREMAAVKKARGAKLR